MSTRSLLLVASSLALVVHPAAAQSLATPTPIQNLDPAQQERAIPFIIPPLSPQLPLLPLGKTAADAPKFRTPAVPLPGSVNLRLAANRRLLPYSSTCYSIRSYGFTPGDLLSDTPTPSSSSTCTPTTVGLLKNAAH